MKRLVTTSVLIIALLLLAGCTNVRVADINAEPEKYMGKTVVISGKVLAPMKLGTISGFTLQDNGASIIVSSEDVPDANTEVKIKGTVVKGILMPYYVYADKITEK